MTEDAVPEPISTKNTTGPISVLLETPQNRVLSWFRVVVALVMGALLVGDVALYSLYQAMRSQVEAHEHRIERLDKMITDVLATNQNAIKLEAITTKVDAIDVQVQELTSTLKDDGETGSSGEPETP